MILLTFGTLEWDKSFVLWDLYSFLHATSSLQMCFFTCVFAKWTGKIIGKILSILSICMPFFPNSNLEAIQFKGTLYSPCSALDTSSHPRWYALYGEMYKHYTKYCIVLCKRLEYQNNGPSRGQGGGTESNLWRTEEIITSKFRVYSWKKYKTVFWHSTTLCD